jgi:hypothetical protein
LISFLQVDEVSTGSSSDRVIVRAATTVWRVETRLLALPVLTAFPSRPENKCKEKVIK